MKKTLYENDFKDDSYSSKRIINTVSTFGKETYFYLQETGYLKAESNRKNERRGLNSFLFVYTLSGKGVLEYKGKVYHINEGDVFFINCLNSHFYIADKDDPWELIWVHFNGGSTANYYNLFEINSEPVVSSKNNDKFKDIINEIIKINNNKTTISEIITSKLLVDLLTNILTTVNFADKVDKKYSNKIQEIVDYIDDNFTKDISLQKISDTFYISKYHLSRELKNYLGIPYMNYVIKKRITYSKELLRFSDKSVENISEAIGINNTSHFILMFKKLEDMTPLSFRKKWRGI